MTLAGSISLRGSRTPRYAVQSSVQRLRPDPTHIYKAGSVGVYFSVDLRLVAGAVMLLFIASEAARPSIDPSPSSVATINE